jgi:peptide/nickel transport system substrate-binding protein
LLILVPEAPDNLNPLYARSWTARILRSLYLEGLWHLDDDLRPRPAMVIELPDPPAGTLSEDGHTFTLHLRPEASWSDGQPVTAEDFLFTYRMATAPQNTLPGRFPYAMITEMSAPTPHTLHLRFERPFAPWPAALFPYVLPRHVLEPVFEQEGTLDHAMWNRVPTVGNGPFVFTRIETGDLIFEANPHYWRGRPEIDRVRVQVQASAEERHLAVAHAGADVVPVLWPERMGWMGAPPDVHFLETPSGLIETLFFNLDPNTGHAALQQRVVRQAIAQSLDRASLCSLLTPDQAHPAYSLWEGSIFGDAGTPGAPTTAGPAELLERAGWRDEDGDGIRERAGVELVLRYATPTQGVDRSAMRAAVEERLISIGIGVEPSSVETGDWDLLQWAETPVGYPDPDDPRWLCVEAHPGGMNRARVCDADLDSLLYAQAATADLDERMAVFHQVGRRNREYVWWVPLCTVNDVWLLSDEIPELHLWRGEPFWNAADW